jgi:hypothetical protein
MQRLLNTSSFDPFMDRLCPSREYTQGAMADKKQFSNTKSIVKVETKQLLAVIFQWTG